MTSHYTPQDERADARRLGFICALSAYFLWGLMPAYYKFTVATPSDAVVAHRIVWSVVFVGLFLMWKGRLGEVWAGLKDRGAVTRLALSASVIAVNWLVFIWAIDEGRVLEVSFGYFTNPLVYVAVGMIVLKEKVRVAQGWAIGIAALAVALQGFVLDSFPWIAVTLALSFTAYGYIRKTVSVGATPGLMIEAVLLAPFALVYLIWAGYFENVENVFPVSNPTLFLLLVGTGAVTAVPLALFAAGARLLPLTTIGFLQYLAPSIHFFFAVWVYHETLDPMRLGTFALIWLSLIIFSVDAFRNRSKPVKPPIA